MPHQPALAEPLLRTAFGDALRRLRRHQGRTLADVSTAARISMTYLSEVERGRKEASSEVLLAICRALGITVAELLVAAHPALVTRPVRTLTSVTSSPSSSASSSAGTVSLRVA